MRILVLAEHDGKSLKSPTFHTVTAALAYKQFVPGANINLVVLGSNVQNVATQAQKVTGIDTVLVGDTPALAHGLAESIAPVLRDLAQGACAILAPATTFGKNILPRIAALVDESQISDVTQIIDQKTFLRPIYAGNALETVTSSCAIQCMTIRTTAFGTTTLTGAATIESILPEILSKADQSLTSFVSQDVAKKERPDLTEARVIVSGGRGLQSGENFVLLEALADTMNGAIGASRAAVDAGYVPNDYQVGQTGKIVAPELYFAIGISGAIQHLAGMKDSKVIVAINKDADAPIFQVADYGLVGDLFDIVPQLTKLIKE